MISFARRNMARYIPWRLRFLAQSVVRGMNRMSDCIFCKIVNNEAQATIMYRDEHATAFRDIHPAAPTHVLIVPNRHIESINAIEEADEQLIGHLFRVARQLAAQEGISEKGYRMITNTGPHGGQTVPHLHLHLIGGQPMKHPMG